MQTPWMWGHQMEPIASQAIEKFSVDEHPVVSTVSMHGCRHAMEDRHAVQVLGPNHPNILFLAVFDGHAGKACTDYVADHLADNIDALSDPHSAQMLTEVFLNTDKQLSACDVLRAGCTAVVVLLEKKGSDVIGTVAHVGDAGALLVSSVGNVVPLTKDHKPWLDAERKRIEKAGGGVWNNRVEGNLAISRAFGNHSTFKSSCHLPPAEQMVIAVPDVQSTIWKEQEWKQLSFLAESMLVEDLGGTIFKHASNLSSLTSAASATVSSSLCEGSGDNHSLILVDLRRLISYGFYKSNDSDNSDKLFSLKRTSEFRPGPFDPFKGRDTWRDTYLDDAKKHGFGPERMDELMKLAKEAEKTMPMPKCYKDYFSSATTSVPEETRISSDSTESKSDKVEITDGLGDKILDLLRADSTPSDNVGHAILGLLKSDSTLETDKTQPSSRTSRAVPKKSQTHLKIKRKRNRRKGKSNW